MVNPQCPIVKANFTIVGPRDVRCDWCRRNYKRNAINNRIHLRSCQKAPPEVKKQAAARINQVKISASQSSSSLDANASNTLSEHNDAEASSSRVQRATIQKQSTLDHFIKRLCNGQNCEIYEDLFCMSVVTGNVSFRTACENEFLAKLFELFTAWKIPNRHRLSDVILTRLYTKVMEVMDERLKRYKFVSIAIDSWTNTRHEGIVNVLHLYPEPLIVDSILANGSSSNHQYYVDLVLNQIENNSHGKEIYQFTAFVTDNEATMNLAKTKLAEKHPHIIPACCWCHVFNICVRKICELPRLKSTIQDAIAILINIKGSHAKVTQWNKAWDNQKAENPSIKVRRYIINYRWFLKSLRIGLNWPEMASIQQIQ